MNGVGRTRRRNVRGISNDNQSKNNQIRLPTSPEKIRNLRRPQTSSFTGGKTPRLHIIKDIKDTNDIDSKSGNVCNLSSKNMLKLEELHGKCDDKKFRDCLGEEKKNSDIAQTSQSIYNDRNLLEKNENKIDEHNIPTDTISFVARYMKMRQVMNT